MAIWFLNFGRRVAQAACALALLCPGAASAKMGVCQIFYHNFNKQKLIASGAEEKVDTYIRIFSANGVGVHPDKKIQKEAYRLISLQSTDSKLLSHWENMSYRDLGAAFSKLKELSETQRQLLVSKAENWDRWVAANIPPATKELVKVGELQIERAKYENIIRAQKKMEAKGIRTKIVAGAVHKRANDAVLLMESAAEKTSAIFPDREIFESKQFRDYLVTAQESGGAIIIEPNMGAKTGAYLSLSKQIVPEKDWVISLRPDSSGAVFVHEWEHKIDWVDKTRYQAQELNGKIDNTRRSVAGKAAWETGRYLEHSYLTEMNATGRELGLYFENKQAFSNGVFETIIYRLKNQRKVAIGRILMDPLNPKHCLLYMYNRLAISAPITVSATVLVGAVAGAMKISKEVEKKELEEFRARQRKREPRLDD